MRKVVAAGLGALMLLAAGCSIQEVPNPVPAVSATASQTPAPSPSVSSAVELPFGGDCAQVLSGELIDALGGQSDAPDVAADNELYALEDAIPVVGGLRCYYGANATDGVVVSILPASMYTDAVRSQWTATLAAECTAWHGLCLRYVEASGLMATIAGVPAAVAQVAEGFMLSAATSAAPHGVELRPWKLACEDIGALVTDATGWNGLAFSKGAMGSDTPDMDLMTSSPALSLCNWRDTSEAWASTGLVATMMQRSVGAPTATALELAGAQPTELAGADQAWIMTTNEQHVRTSMIAVVGEDRITVTVGVGPESGVDGEAVVFGLATAIVQASVAD